MIVRDIYKLIDGFAPFDTALEYDNVGLLIGDMNAPADKIGVCLDATAPAVEAAVQNGLQLIVCHHPIIFNPLRSVSSDSVVYTLIQNNISLIAAHTNLDIASGGVCEQLCAAVGLEACDNLYDGTAAVGRIARSSCVDVMQLAAAVKRALAVDALRVVGTRPIERVAVIPGAGGEYITAAAAAGADTVLTGEVKHHEWIEAGAHGINVIDAGHYFTELPIVGALCERLPGAMALPQAPPYRKV